MEVEWDTSDSFANSRRVAGPDATPHTDLTAKLDLVGLPPGERVFYRVRFMDLDRPAVVSEPVEGTFRTAPLAERNIRFAWSADTCGQGWGIDPDRGGMRIYETMRQQAPDFFLHSGDTIYADNPLPKSIRLADGTLWRNIVTPAKSKVAETLDEFRGNHAYNYLDENLRRFCASVPVIAQWDDHEVRNNWYPGQTLESDVQYTVKDVNTLAERARRAFFEYQPIRWTAGDPWRIYRSLSFGPMMDLFVLDQRSYRGRNSRNRQTELTDESAWMGAAQINWLKQALLRSKATWKIIASDMPLGLIAADGSNFEACANGDAGMPLGRELEIADLLRFCKEDAIRNMVWLTADVHYACAHYYDPAAAAFKEFDGFWEFVSGPLHAGSFGPNLRDNTFGPQLKWQALAPRGGMGPADGYQFFGTVAIDGRSRGLTMQQFDLAGRELYKLELKPVA